MLFWYLPAPGPCRSGAPQPAPVLVLLIPSSPSSGRWVGAGGGVLSGRSVCVCSLHNGRMLLISSAHAPQFPRPTSGGAVEVSLDPVLRPVQLLPRCSSGSLLCCCHPRLLLLCITRVSVVSVWSLAEPRWPSAVLKGGDAVALLGQRGFGQRLAGRGRRRRRSSGCSEQCCRAAHAVTHTEDLLM